MKIIISVLFIFGVIIFFTEFILTKFFNINFIYLTGIRNYMILISTFLAMTTGILNDKNIKMDILNKYGKKSIFFILKNIISLLISAVITFLFIKYILFEIQNNVQGFFNINRYYFLIPYVIVFFISFFLYLYNIINYLRVSKKL